jgi:hypothetical protein
MNTWVIAVEVCDATEDEQVSGAGFKMALKNG